MKRAQIMGQPIIFIFIAIVAILTLTLGIKYIYKLNETSKETQVVRELKEIEADLQRIYQLSYQSSEKFTYSFPSSVNKICFLKEPRDINRLDLEEREKIYIESSTNKNIFIFTEPIGKYRTTYSKFVGTTNCFEINGRIDLIFTNGGQTVTITQVNTS